MAMNQGQPMSAMAPFGHMDLRSSCPRTVT